MTDVVVEVQVWVVDPNRATKPEGDETQLLPKARHQVKTRGDVVAELLVGGRWPLEQGRRGDVHVGGAVLEVEEGGVQPAEPVPVGHEPNLLRTGARCAADPRQRPRGRPRPRPATARG